MHYFTRGVFILIVYMVMNHCEKTLETTNYQNAVNTCKQIDSREGYGASSLWYMDTNKSNTFSRLNFYTNSATTTPKSSASVNSVTTTPRSSVSVRDNSIWRK